MISYLFQRTKSADAEDLYITKNGNDGCRIAKKELENVETLIEYLYLSISLNYFMTRLWQNQQHGREVQIYCGSRCSLYLLRIHCELFEDTIYEGEIWLELQCW